MSKEKFVKLNPDSSIFQDTSIGFMITGDQVLPFKSEWNRSKRFSKALKGGHLETADKDDYKEFLEREALRNSSAKSVDTTKTQANDEDAGGDEKSFSEMTEKELKKKNNEVLIADILENSDWEEADLIDFKKKDLIALILNNYEEEGE